MGSGIGIETEKMADKKKIKLLMLSFPRQGTRWIVKNIETSSNITCSREHFNNLVPPAIKNDKINKVFGHQKNIESIFNYDIDILNNIIEKCNKPFISENWSPNKIPELVGKTNIFIFYRHRYYTFPGTNPDSTKHIITTAASCIKSIKTTHKEEIELIEEGKRLIKEDDIMLKATTLHIIFFYFLLKDATKYNIPVINWTDLMTKSVEEVDTIFSKIPGKVINTKTIAKNLIRSRKGNLDNKKKKYDKLGIEHKLSGIKEIINNSTFIDNDLKKILL